MLVGSSDSFKIIAMASLSVSIEERSFKVSNLILLHTRTATPPLCLLITVRNSIIRYIELKLAFKSHFDKRKNVWLFKKE